MAEDPVSVVNVSELNVSDPMKLRLEAEDLPHGYPREMSAWEEGGEQKLGDAEGTLLPGRLSPIFQVLNSAFRPRVLRGAWRDHFWAETGRAKRMRDSFEQMRLRGNLVLVDWDLDGFTGLLKETRFGIEGPSDIVYELTFLVATPFFFEQQSAAADVPYENAGADLVAQLLADAEALRAEEAALAMTATLTEYLAPKWDGLVTALESAQEAVTLLQSGTIGVAQQARNAVQRTLAAASEASDAARALSEAFNGAEVGAAVTRASVVNQAQFAAHQADAIDMAATISDAMRSVQQQARSALRETSRLYLVQDGDTLDGVALSVYQDRSRAQDLGLTQGQLAASVGKYIRVAT